MNTKIIYTIISTSCLITYLYGAITNTEPVTTTRLLVIAVWFSVLAKLEGKVNV